MTLSQPGANADGLTQLAGALFGSVPGRTVNLDPDARVVTRQQLTDPAFYAQVRSGVLDGSITVVDQRVDSLRIGDAEVPLTSADALQALAASEASWVGAPDPNPFLSSLMRGQQ